MNDLPLSAPVFIILRRLIAEHLGIDYVEGDATLLASKLTPRVRELGLDSLLDYYYFLRYDPGAKTELDTLAEYLVVNETYFFRELEPMRVMVDEFLRPQIAARQKVRVWSAACSTGEEPLTLAMLLAERGLLQHVDIVATDLSERALTHARRGQYRGRSLRELPRPEMRAYLDTEGNVAPTLVASIHFERLNLLDVAGIAALGAFDVILCRNVLIYFSDDTAKRVIDAMLATLVPDGVLQIGISESLFRIASLVRCEERAGHFFYRAAKA